jgi:large repetitive protein
MRMTANGDRRHRAAVPARSRLAASDGYTRPQYLIAAGVLFVIVAGGLLLFSLIRSSTSPVVVAPVPSASAVPTSCPAGQWLDVVAGSCVPAAECTVDQEYDEKTNTCVTLVATVDGITPVTGPTAGGTEVTITGTRFVDGAQVAFDGVPATAVRLVDAATLKARTPPSENTFPVDVTVTLPDGSALVLNNAFTYVAPPTQRLDRVDPATGSVKGGERVIVKGAGFVDGARLAFYGREATDVRVVNDSTILATTPTGTLGKVAVTLRLPNVEPLSLEKGFRYVDTAPRVVTGVKPVRGAEAGGTKVTILGSAFRPGAKVAFAGKPASDVKVVSSTRITAATPPGALGPVDVSVRNPGVPAATLAQGFEYVTAPTVTGVRPPKGPTDGGTKVTIAGTGFAKTAKVAFDGAAAQDVKVVSETSITAKTPKGAVGPAKVTVVIPGQPAAALAKAFTYVEPVVVKPPVTPKPGQPRCRPFTLPAVSTPSGDDLILQSADLFPGSTGVTGARLANATFAGRSGGRSDGTILWQGSPPLIDWQTPAEAGKGGTITYTYTASSCAGQAQAKVQVSSS